MSVYECDVALAVVAVVADVDIVALAVAFTVAGAQFSRKLLM